MRLLRSSLVPLSLTLALVSSSCSSRPGPGDVPSTYTDRPDGVLAALAGAESAQLFALHPNPFQREIRWLNAFEDRALDRRRQECQL